MVQYLINCLYIATSPENSDGFTVLVVDVTSPVINISFKINCNGNFVLVRRYIDAWNQEFHWLIT